MFTHLSELIRRDGLAGVASGTQRRFKRLAATAAREYRARHYGSYEAQTPLVLLQTRLNGRLRRSIRASACIPAQVADHYLNHRFDVLGSGWVQVRHGMACRGLARYSYAMGEPVKADPAGVWLRGRINPSNLSRAQAVWQLVDPEYRPIDWQLDFKSGFRWSEAVWGQRLTYGHHPGVDVKVPWELARMQHLPQLALRTLALSEVPAEDGSRLAREVRNQILDFIATNPPGFGVNWLCPMDVAIRATNWLLARDILLEADLPFEAEAEAAIVASILDHGLFLSRNLEWHPQHRGNHYLSHICGLAFIAAYLPESDQTTGWLAFALQHLQLETLRQFYPDGGNFEQSIAYHRLSAEMVLFTTALFLGLPEERMKTIAAVDPSRLSMLPQAVARLHGHKLAHADDGRRLFQPAFVERLAALMGFFAGVLKADGSFPQVGDNDSGRFLKLQPVFTKMTVSEAVARFVQLQGYSELPDTETYWFEETLNGSHLLGAASALGDGVTRFAGSDHDVLEALAHAQRLDRFNWAGAAHHTAVPPAESPEARLAVPEGATCAQYRFPVDVHASGGLTLHFFPDFGCFVFKHPAFYLLVRCLLRPADRFVGHYHDDQLSIELDIGGRSVIRDPGTYVYTALPLERNRYRAGNVHFSPLTATAAVTIRDLAPFDRFPVSPAILDYAGERGFAARVPCAGGVLGLIARIEKDAILVIHYSTMPGNVAQPAPLSAIPYSPGYGILEYSSS